MDNVVAWESMQFKKLANYDEQIQFFVAEERWQDLIEILDERLSYLQTVFSASLPIEYRGAAKRLIDSVLINDTEFQNEIQRKKSVLADQQVTIQRNSRAIQSYSELIP